MNEPYTVKCDQEMISEEDREAISRDFIVDAMARMSNWLSAHNLVGGGYRIPEEGTGGCGIASRVIVGNVGLWNATKEMHYLDRVVQDADFLVRSVGLGGSDMDYALWVVCHYLKNALPPEKIGAYRDMLLNIAGQNVGKAKDDYGTHLDTSTNFQHLGMTSLSWAILHYFDRNVPAAAKINDKIEKFFDPSYGWAIGDGTVRYSGLKTVEQYDDWARCDLDLHYDVWIKNYLHRAWHILRLCGADIAKAAKAKMDFGDTAAESYYVPGWKNNFRCTKRHRWVHADVPFELARLLMKSATNHHNPFRAWMAADIVRCLRTIQQDDGSLPARMFNSPCTETYQCNRMSATGTAFGCLAEVLESWYEPQEKPEPRCYVLSGTTVARGGNYYIQVTGPGAIIDEISGGFKYHLYEARGTLIKGGNYAWYSLNTERMMTDSPIEKGQTSLISIANVVYGTMSDTKATQEIVRGKGGRLDGQELRYIAWPTTPDGEDRAPLKVESTYGFYEDYVVLRRTFSATSDIEAQYVMDRHSFRIPFDTTVYYHDGSEHKVVIPHEQRCRYAKRQPVDAATMETPRWVYLAEHGFGMVIQHTEALRLRVWDSNDWGNMSGYQLGYLIFDYPVRWTAGAEKTTQVVLLNAPTIEAFREKVGNIQNRSF